ncbi:MAG TPA: aldehyde dehydrogenase family protein [Flavobacteriales bacterium]|nr:aldehyde dehydrogenase family protein [Flavobacteriales bacterium]
MKLDKSFEKLEYSKALESDKEAMQWLTKKNNKFGQFIGGEFISKKDAETITVMSPADNSTLAHIEIADDKLIDLAIKSAGEAQEKWYKSGGHSRAKVLYALARLIQKNARVISVLETLDNGKPIRESRDSDIPLAVRHFYYHAGWAQLQKSELKNSEPVGVVAQIIPWNFPFLMLAWKISPALAMGNAIVLKPAENTPLTAMFFAGLCEEAGVPAGVINIINGAGETGAALAAHPDVNKVAFTGSTAVGRSIRKSTAGQGKKLTLELGGKSAFVVFEDADLDSVVEGVVDAIWYNQGEVCCAGSRLLVQASIEESLVKKLKARMANLRFGTPLDKSIDVGSLVSSQQFSEISKMVKEGLKSGGELFSHEKPDSTCNYYPPSLITDVDSSHPLVQEEIFGPVLVVSSFRTQEEAIKLANNTRYGLAASVWSENINRAMHVAPGLIAGVVWINCHNKFDAACGFGGVKESGYGREGGKEGLFEYLKPIKSEYNSSISPVSPNGLASKQEIDKTLKFYIGGKQTRPDGGNSSKVLNADGSTAAFVGLGNRKDIRNAVSAAKKAESWSGESGHLKAQILYFLAENLSNRKDEFVTRLQTSCGSSKKEATSEFDETISRLFSYAAWADKYDGAAHNAPYRGVTLALPEAIGVIGIIAPEEQPLLNAISLIAPAVAMGNCVVFVAGERHSNIVFELVSAMETSDIPGGVINIIAGDVKELAPHLAGHGEVGSVWAWANKDVIKEVETLSAENLKRTWCHDNNDRNWLKTQECEGVEFIRHATQIKNIWTPYGD